jgi:hypothetical protein
MKDEIMSFLKWAEIQNDSNNIDTNVVAAKSSAARASAGNPTVGDASAGGPTSRRAPAGDGQVTQPARQPSTDEKRKSKP